MSAEQRIPLSALQVQALQSLEAALAHAGERQGLYLSAILEGAGIQHYVGARIDGQYLVVRLPDQPEQPATNGLRLMEEADDGA